MGSVVKSIGKVIKKVTSGIGKLIKKIGPALLLAAGLFMGTAAFGSTLGTAAGGNMFSWGNFTQGAGAIGSSIFGGGGGASATKTALQTAGTALGTSGNIQGLTSQGAFTSTGPLDKLGQVTGVAGNVAGALGGGGGGLAQGSGIFNFIKSAMKDSPAMSLMAISQLVGTGLEIAGALFDTSEEDALAESKRQFDISNTYAGFAPGSTKVSDLPADSPYFRKGGPMMPSMDSFQMAAKASREPGFGRQPSDTTFGKVPSVAGARGPSILGESGMGMISGNDPRRYT